MNEVKKSGLPLVFVDTDTLKFGYCSVVADFGQAMQEALEVFWGQGKERIALLDGDLDSNFDKNNLVDFRFPNKTRLQGILLKSIRAIEHNNSKEIAWRLIFSKLFCLYLLWIMAAFC